MNTTYETKSQGLYRSRNGVILGVCRGLADHFDFSVFWMRFLWIAIMLLTGFWPVLIAYFIAGLIMKPEPVIPFANESDQEFYNSYASSSSLAVNRLRRTYENLDRRIRRIESIVTSKDFNWNRRIRD